MDKLMLLLSLAISIPAIADSRSSPIDVVLNSVLGDSHEGTLATSGLGCDVSAQQIQYDQQSFLQLVYDYSTDPAYDTQGYVLDYPGDVFGQVWSADEAHQMITGGLPGAGGYSVEIKYDPHTMKMTAIHTVAQYDWCILK